MKIIVDAMGGDNAPAAQIEGACMASGLIDADIILCGKADIINDELKKHTYDKNRITVKDCPQVIENEDDPVYAARRKKDSSMVVGLKMVAEHEGDAFVSSGNTGALIAASVFYLKRIRGISRPALAPVLPSAHGPVILMDSGANAVCKPENLYSFALMGSHYMQNILNVESPRVGLINIGTEPHKGTPLQQETYSLLSDSGLNFIGNVEARDVLSCDADVLVTDGFTGNIVIKLIEGSAKFLFSQIKDIFYKNIFTKFAALTMKKGLLSLKARFNYKEHGGAPLLGVDGVVIKAHGSSDAYAFLNAIKQAKSVCDSGLIQKITAAFEQEISVLNEE